MSAAEAATARRKLGELVPGVSRETWGQLEILVELLVKWQKAINLVGQGTLDDVWARHILDSGQLVPFIPDKANTLADLGSGAGFPGLVLAALHPRLAITLIESDARKAAFLGEASRLMGLQKPPKIMIGRIESLPSVAADVVTARALAPLAQLLAWANRHRAANAICLFHKGKDWQAELTEATRGWDIAATPHGSATQRDAVILRIGSFERRDSGRSSGAAGDRDRQPKRRGWQDDHGD
jgi:16S rRNA (guanine527-N7)-methyltransferase